MSANSSAAATSDGAAAGAPHTPHSSEGPEPVAATAEEKQESPVAAPAEEKHGVGRLYQDVLNSVFDFLPLADLSRVLSVSRSWYGAVGAMPCARLMATCTMPRLVPLCASMLSRHVTGFVGPPPSELRCESLYTVALRLPHLRVLKCSIVPSETARVILPHRLASIELELFKISGADINAIIRGISQLRELVALGLDLPSFLLAISFAPLSAVASLEELHLATKSVSEPTDAQVNQLRALPRLRRLVIALYHSLEPLSSQSLPRLLRPPHNLRWQEISPVKPVDAAASAALATLPSLQRLFAWDCTDVGFLARLRQLRTLDLRVRQPWPATITPNAVVDGLSSCTQMTEMKIAAPLHSNHLSVLLPRLPLLTRLFLTEMSELESLACLSSGPLTHKLRTLSLWDCRHAALTPLELEHIYALTSLEDLTLVNSFTESLTRLEIRLHTPPSRLMPKLRKFRYDKLK